MYHAWIGTRPRGSIAANELDHLREPASPQGVFRRKYCSDLWPDFGKYKPFLSGRDLYFLRRDLTREKRSSFLMVTWRHYFKDNKESEGNFEFLFLTLIQKRMNGILKQLTLKEHFTVHPVWHMLLWPGTPWGVDTLPTRVGVLENYFEKSFSLRILYEQVRH